MRNISICWTIMVKCDKKKHQSAHIQGSLSTQLATTRTMQDVVAVQVCERAGDFQRRR